MFPKNFAWGVDSSAYQIEGRDREDGASYAESPWKGSLCGLFHSETDCQGFGVLVSEGDGDQWGNPYRKSEAEGKA